MSKKGLVIASVFSAAVVLGGCTPRQPIPSNSPAYQAGPSTKLGHSHHNKYHKCHCKHLRHR